MHVNSIDSKDAMKLRTVLHYLIFVFCMYIVKLKKRTQRKKRKKNKKKKKEEERKIRCALKNNCPLPAVTSFVVIIFVKMLDGEGGVFLSFFLRKDPIINNSSFRKRKMI
jgi:hypothetical protein